MTEEELQRKMELSWAGGFIDGEGCFYNAKQAGGYYCTIFTIVNTELELIERFHKAIGGLGNTQLLPRVKENPKWKPAYQLRISKYADLITFITMIYLYMSPPKRRQYNRCIKLQNESRLARFGEYRVPGDKRNYGNFRTTRAKKPVTDE